MRLNQAYFRAISDFKRAAGRAHEKASKQIADAFRTHNLSAAEQVLEGIKIHTALGFAPASLEREAAMFEQDVFPDPVPQPRNGDWIQTYMGIRFYVLDPRPEEVCLEDIAHALSLQCRYQGHALSFYSTAEHCVHLARWVLQHTGDYQLAFAALMHDAAEAYLPDMARPTKNHMPIYREVEAKLDLVIMEKFGILKEWLSYIKPFDTRILMDERKTLFIDPLRWGTDDKPLHIVIKCWKPRKAERKFHEMYHMLTEELAKPHAI